MCWVVFALHFATNIVREIYLAIAIGDHCTFRVDEYAGLHPDLFETPGKGWHINNNPGVSMFAAIPYWLNRPWIDRVVARVRATRSTSATPPRYESPWSLAREFYAKAWRRGLDIKLGLAALVMQLFFMAPVSALGVVLMFYVLRYLFASNRAAFWLSILYGFGTPIFFRTGTLNQNLVTAHTLFAGFALLWNPANLFRWKSSSRNFLAGIAGGLCLLFDYSGLILLVLLLIYSVFKSEEDRGKNLLFFILGCLLPILLLWFYQSKSFGNPFYPPQSHMPAINPWVETGFYGYVFPRLDLMSSLLFDYRYGLFVSCPILLLAFLSFFVPHLRFQKVELRFSFLFFFALWIFFSGVNYAHLQFNTGIRYLVPTIPFLFIPAAIVLLALPRFLALLLSSVALFQSWCLAMYRDVERGMGVFEPVIQILRNGFQLPALTTLNRMEAFKDSLPFGANPLPLFICAGVVIFFIWRTKTQSSTT
jgi:hypothetical protein